MPLLAVRYASEGLPLIIAKYGKLSRTARGNFREKQAQGCGVLAAASGIATCSPTA